MKTWIENIDAWNGNGVLSIVGPTGSGKTAAALHWVNSRHPRDRACPLLVSVDAVALYRHLDIGSAKPLGAERDGYDWVGLDLYEPTERVSAADFAERVRPKIQAALAVGRPVILVGGSHFYEQALVAGMSPGAPTNEAWTASLRELPGSVLKARLVALDPRWQARVHENDRYRLLRFLDLSERQGLSYDILFHRPKEGALEAPHARLALGLEEDLDVFSTRLGRRIDAMFAAGWGSEVHALLNAGVPVDAPGLQAVGYRELVAARGQWSSEGAPSASLREQVLLSHLQLAKKQRSWVRGLLANYSR